MSLDPGLESDVRAVERVPMSEATVAVNEAAIEPRLVGADARVAGPARILIVDDELAIRESLDALLGMEGFEVTLAVALPAAVPRRRAGQSNALLDNRALKLAAREIFCAAASSAHNKLFRGPRHGHRALPSRS